MIDSLTNEIPISLGADHGAGVMLAQKRTLRFFFALSATQLAARLLAGGAGRCNPIFE